MNNHTAHIFGQLTTSLSLIVALLALAPFTAAIVLIPFLLPVAVLVVWRGALAAGLLTLLFCALAIVISPLRLAQILEWPIIVAWLSFCSIAIIFSAFRCARKAKEAEHA